MGMVLPLEILIVLAALSVGIQPSLMAMVIRSTHRILIILLILHGVDIQALVGEVHGAIIRSTLPTVFMVAASMAITITATTTSGTTAPTTTFRLLTRAAAQELIILIIITV